MGCRRMGVRFRAADGIGVDGGEERAVRAIFGVRYSVFDGERDCVEDGASREGSSGRRRRCRDCGDE